MSTTTLLHLAADESRVTETCGPQNLRSCLKAHELSERETRLAVARAALPSKGECSRTSWTAKKDTRDTQRAYVTGSLASCAGETNSRAGVYRKG